MAVVNTLDSKITGFDATPVEKAATTLHRASVRAVGGTAAKAAGDSNASVYRLARVRSDDSIALIKLYNDALSGATDADLGLYETAANGGAVVDKDCYADGISLASASTAGTDLTFSARDINAIDQYVWEDAGLTADPGKEYDLCLTLNTAGGAAGDVTVRGLITNN